MLTKNLICKYYKIYKDNGVAGINRKAEHLLRTNLLIKLAYSLSNKSKGLVNFLKDVEEFDVDTGRLGHKESSLKYLSKFKINIASNIPSWIVNKNKPILFYSNHRSIYDPFFLFSTIKRQDLKIFGAHIIYNIGPNIKKRILQVMSKSYAVDRKRKYTVMERILDNGTKLTLDKIRQINKEGLERGISFLKKGYATGIFPTGIARNINDWQKGIGIMIANIPHKFYKKISLCPIYIKGITTNELVNKLKRYYTNKSIKKTDIKISLGKKVAISNMIKRETDPLKIVKILKTDYLKQFGF